MSSDEDDEDAAKENENPTIENLPICEQILTQFSWFSVLWKCENATTLDFPNRNNEDKSNKNDQSKVQFLVFYKFEETKNKSLKSSDLSIIGMLSYKMDRDSFWFTPTHLNSQNDMQGALLDEIHESNLIRNSDMQERAIDFIHSEAQVNSSSDYQFFVNNMGGSTRYSNQYMQYPQSSPSVQIANYIAGSVANNVLDPFRSPFENYANQQSFSNSGFLWVYLMIRHYSELYIIILFWTLYFLYEYVAVSFSMSPVELEWYML